MTTTISKEPSAHFADNFWESFEKNGITIMIERMRGAKQTCERFKNAYEARALLEEEYGKTLLQIAHKQKASSLENGSSKNALDTMQAQFQSVAESHLQLSDHLRENVALPLSKLLNKQRVLRKELQTSIQKLYNNRQIQVHFVRRAHKRHNLEIEKANLLVQQQISEKDKRATFRTAETTIDKLKKVYEEALNDLTKIVQEWNTEWKQTCESFEKLEQERLDFFKTNLSTCAHSMISCLEKEIQAYEKIDVEAGKIDVAQDLAQFVNLNKSTNVVPSPMEYIKLHAYHEANQDRGDLKQHHAIRDNIDNDDHSDAEDRVPVRINRKRSNTASSVMSDTKIAPKKLPEEHHIELDKKQVERNNSVATPPITHVPEVKAPVMMVGVMEVYASGEDEDSSDEYEYVTETESEGEEDAEQSPQVQENNKEVQGQEATVPKENELNREVEPQTATDMKEEEISIREEEPAPVAPPRTNIRPLMTQEPSQSSIPQDEKVDRLMNAYQQEIQKERNSPPAQRPQASLLMSKNNGFNPKRRVSFVETSNTAEQLSNLMQNVTPSISSSSTLERYSTNYSNDRNVQTPEAEEEIYNHSTADDAAYELDDMLRELDSKRIIRDGVDDSISYRNQPDIKPTASISSPSLLQKQQQRRSNITPVSQYFSHGQKQQFTRRMSTIESPSYSRQSSFGTMNSNSSYMGIYDPFNSLSSKETGSSTVNSNPTSQAKFGSVEDQSSDTNSTPSAQMIHDRMLKNSQKKSSYHRRTTSASSSGSIRSIEQPTQRNNFIQDFYSVNSKTPSPENTVQKRVNPAKFIDFALALYDYEEADEGEISFKEGDLFGIISKSEEDDEQGWWEASLLNRRNQRVVRTGLVPSNFLETVSK